MNTPQISNLSSKFTGKPIHTYNVIDPGKDIRLLTLHPADPSDPELISCQLDRVSLGPGVAYAALSYTWGDSTKRKPIMCDGGRLDVTVNLFNALRELRHVDQGVRLWIDAVCINQQDTNEKNEQVGKMGEIYKNAHEVWIWLGEKSEGTSRAYRLIEELHSHFDLERIEEKYLEMALGPWSKDLQSPPRIANRHVVEAVAAMRNVEEALSIQSLAPGEIDDRRALEGLFASAWFTRKWIIQEIVFAQEARAFCGTQSIHWRILKRVSEILPSCVANMTLRNMPADSPFPLLLGGLNRAPATAAIASTSAGASLLFLLASTAEFECSTKVDRYFALHSLAAEAEDPNWPLKPDYDLTLREVAFRFGKWNIINKSDPSILQYIESDESKDPPGSKVPSWVPRFDAGRYSVIGREGMDDLWKCSGNSKLDAWVSDAELTLGIKGRTLESLARVEVDESVRKTQAQIFKSEIPSLNNGLGFLSSLFNLSPCQDPFSWATANYSLLQLLEPAVRYRNLLHSLIGAVHDFRSETSMRMCVVLLKVLMINVLDGKDKPGHEISQTFLNVLREILQCRPRPEAELRDLLKDPGFHTLFEALIDSSRLYCATANDLIAVAPQASRAGDKICLFYGCKTPFVIRPLADGKYSLVGPCYLHGMMHGEGLGDGEDDEKFILR